MRSIRIATGLRSFASLFLLFGVIFGPVIFLILSGANVPFPLSAVLDVCCIFALILLLVAVYGVKVYWRDWRDGVAYKGWHADVVALRPHVRASLNVLKEPLERILPDLQRAVQETPDDPDAYTRLAFALNMLGRSQEELDASERALRLAPLHASAWGRKAAALANLGRTKDALAACDKALSLDPQDASAWRTKAHMLSRIGHRGEALRAFEHVLLTERESQLPSESGLSLYHTAAGLQLLRRYAQAVDAYDRVIAIYPDCVAAWVYKATCLRALNRREPAHAALLHARSLVSAS